MSTKAVVRGALLVVCCALVACSREPAAVPERSLPTILLVTLDTTRADRVGFEYDGVETPNLDALARRGVRFAHAYATAPMTLPSHTSMLTGLYPAAHGVHENGRYVADGTTLLAPLLKERSYTTAAIVSSFSLAREFGLDRGFDHYDDDFGPNGLERDAVATTDRALAFLESNHGGPLFFWVHYFDPHEPYNPPEPFRSQYLGQPYLGEIALMDRELGRLLEEFEKRFSDRDRKILVIGDHGQGLGDHGEQLHGKLLYQGVMRVPLVIAGSGISAGEITRPVSVRRVFHTILDCAGGDESDNLLTGETEIVMGEALKPFLDYGWQPQVMAIDGRIKVIRSGETEVYDVEADPSESHDLAGEIELGDELQRALRDYAVPSPGSTAEAGGPSREAREKLARLGYIFSESRPAVRANAPSAKDMTFLFHDLDLGATMFLQDEYAMAIPIFERVLAADPENTVACLRLAVAHSVLGHEGEADSYFGMARRLDPDSLDLRYYAAVHLFRFGHWDEAEPLFESILPEMPKKVGVLMSMMQIREREGRIDEARSFLRRAMALEQPTADEYLKLGELSMQLMDTPTAIDAFERARRLQGADFMRSLELGVCYMASGRLPEAAMAFDQVSQLDPDYPFALYKRAQVSVILGEPDRDQRIRLAYERGDREVRELMENDPLFQGLPLR